MKITNNGIPNIRVKTLIITETILLEKNPELLKAPKNILEELAKGPASFDDELGGIAISIDYDSSDQTVVIKRKDTGEAVIPFYGFWFSVIAVHPDVEVYKFGK